MSIATEIARLRAAKESIREAIESKGITVPSTTKIGGYAALIKQIIGPNELTTDPKYGDAVYMIPSGEFRFVKLDTLTPASLPSTWVAVGYVEQEADESGKIVICEKSNASYKAAAVFRWKITGFSLDGEEHTCDKVILHKVDYSSTPFTYTASTPQQFAAALDAYVRGLASTYDYYAYYDALDGNVYLIIGNYTAYEEGTGATTWNITGMTFEKAVYNELTANSTLKSKRGVKSGNTRTNYWQVLNRARIIEYIRLSTSSSYNPTSWTWERPVSLTCYLSKWDTWTALQSYEKSEAGWLEYLDDNFTCDLDAAGTATADATDPLTGSSLRDGKANTYALANTTYVDKSGARQYLYPAMRYAADCSYAVEGAGKGEWFVPSIYQGFLWDSKITMGLAGVTRATADKGNQCLNKIGGTQVTCTSHHWFSSRYSTTYACYYLHYGPSYNYYFYFSFTVRRFLLYQLP